MKNFWDVGKKVVGVLLIIAGTLGLFLPFLQGVMMIVVGAVLLGNKKIIKWGKRLVKQFKRG